jgi:cytochrome c biogenesis protein CcmG/thiol:disulfide interchange protein DsbE
MLIFRKFSFIIGLILLLVACGTGSAVSPGNSPSTSALSVPVNSGLVTDGSANGERLALGQAAPDFKWQENNETKGLVQLKGHPVILNWWASWCEPCRIEMPLLTETAHTQANLDQALVVIGINLKEGDTDVQHFANQYKPGFKLVRDEQALLSFSYGVRGLPQTIFIDRAGIVRAIVRGSLTAETLEDKLKAIMP